MIFLQYCLSDDKKSAIIVDRKCYFFFFKSMELKLQKSFGLTTQRL